MSVLLCALFAENVGTITNCSHNIDVDMRYHAIAIFLLMISAPLAGCTLLPQPTDPMSLFPDRYVYLLEDHFNATTNATNDSLVIVTLEAGHEDIQWSNISIILGDANTSDTFQCNVDAVNGNCVIMQLGSTDNYWEIGENIIIEENGVDICNPDDNPAGICDMWVTITDTRSGELIDYNNRSVILI